MNYRVLRLFVLCTVLFSCAISSAMAIDAEIKQLKIEREELLSKIEKKAGGNSTIAYRAWEKKAQADLSAINTIIMLLEHRKSKL